MGEKGIAGKGTDVGESMEGGGTLQETGHICQAEYRLSAGLFRRQGMISSPLSTVWKKYLR